MAAPDPQERRQIAWTFQDTDAAAPFDGNVIATITMDGRWLIDWPAVRAAAAQALPPPGPAASSWQAGHVAFCRLLLAARGPALPEANAWEAERIALAYGAAMRSQALEDSP